MSIPYFPLYPTDYEADTAHLSLEEDGAYNRLLRLMWMTPGCSVPDDAVWIARRMRVDTVTFLRLVEPIIDEFCKRIGGRVVSPRLQSEWEKIAETSRKHSDAAKKRWNLQGVKNKVKVDMPSISVADAMHMQPEPYPEPYPEPKPQEKKDGASATKPADDVSAILCQWAGSGAVESFIAYRKRKKGGAMTVTAAKRLAKHLKAIFDRGGDTDDALGMAEERTWQTVEADWYFNAKGKKNGNGHHNNGNPPATGRDSFLDEIAIAARSRPAPGSFGH